MKPPMWLCACLLIASVASADDAAFFNSDRAHPWNRLWAALHTGSRERADSTGACEARVLAGDNYRESLRALDEFLATPTTKHIKSPLRRAILQNELWQVFDAVAEPRPTTRKNAFLPADLLDANGPLVPDAMA